MTIRRATFILLTRLFFLLAFLCAASPSVPSFAEKALPHREASLASPGGIGEPIVLCWSFGKRTSPNTFRFVRDFFGWQRNNYDKLGHFAQGFVPAIVAREILIRNSMASGRGWLNLFVISACLAFSALYELFEWAVAVVTGDSVESFLGTQGYVWVTQADMAMALLGAGLALIVLGRLHDGQLKALPK